MCDKDKIFSILCRHCCSIMDGWIPLPSTIIHWQLPDLSLYMVRKYLKMLKNDGLITSDLYVDQGDDRPILVRGYIITEKGKDTEAYKQAYNAERALCLECFNFDIDSNNVDWFE